MKLRKLNNFLNSRVVGQKRACQTLAESIILAEMKPHQKNTKPKGSFILLGPTGVGKTSLVLSTLEFLYESPNKHFVRLDMAEYQAPDSIKSLLGRDERQQGILGDSIDKLESNGGGILLFDEIEKAHSATLKILLSILDEGHTRMSTKEIKYFKNTYLFFTSNLGCAKITQAKNLPTKSIEKIVTNGAQMFFSPELFARFDHHIILEPLDFNNQTTIARESINRTIKQWNEARHLNISLDENSVIPYLLRENAKSELGARRLIKTIEQSIGKAISLFCLYSNEKDISLREENNNLICEKTSFDL